MDRTILVQNILELPALADGEVFRDQVFASAGGEVALHLRMDGRVDLSASLVSYPAETQRALRVLVPPLVDCLRVAGDLDGGDIYDLLAKAGIIRKFNYVPGEDTHVDAMVVRGEIEVESPYGDEIWILTDLGEQFIP